MSNTIEKLLQSNLMDFKNGSELLIDNSAFLTGAQEAFTFLQRVKIHQEVVISVNICTLGHVDNGKTTMTAALAQSTVANIDRSAEEKERGITINTTVVQYKRLFVYKKSDLPTNVLARITPIANGLEVLLANGIAYMTPESAFNAVDVSKDVIDLSDEYVLVKTTYIQADAPGHRDFLKNAIKGMSSADVILLIVGSHYESLKEQAQTLEHLFLLRKFGIPVAIFFNQIDSYFPDAIKQAVGLSGPGSNTKIEDTIIASDDEMATLNLSGLFEEIKKSLGEVPGPLERLKHESSELIVVAGTSGLLASRFDLNRPLAARQCTAQMQHTLNQLLKSIATYSLKGVKRITNRPFCLSIDGAPVVGRGKVYTGSVMTGSIKVGDEVAVYTKKDKVEAVVTSMQQFHKDQQQSFAGDNIALLLRLSADTAKFVDQITPHCVITAKNANYTPIKRLIVEFNVYGSELGGRSKENILRAGYSGTIFIKSGNYNYAVVVREIYPMYSVNEKFIAQKAILDPANSSAGLKGAMTVMVPGDRNGYIVVLEALAQDILLPITKDEMLVSESQLGIYKSDSDAVSAAKKASATAMGAKGDEPAFIAAMRKDYHKFFDIHENDLKPTFVFMESDLSVGSGRIITAVKP